MNSARPLLVLALMVCAGVAEARPANRFVLYGTEPFWDVHLRGGRMRLHSDLHDFTVRAIGPMRRGRTLVWISAPHNRSWRIVLTPERCSDGMSEHHYRYHARVWLDGALSFDGCADRE